MGDQAHRLLRLMLTEPDGTPGDAGRLLGLSEAELASALDQLTEMGLARRLEQGGETLTATPDVVLAQMIAQQEKETRARVEELETIGETLSALNASLMRFQAQSDMLPGITRLSGERQISVALEGVAACARREVLSMHPGPPLPPAMLKQSMKRNREVIGRGVAMRSIHLMAMLNIPYSRAHLEELRDVGAQVRVASVLPFRQIIADRVVAYVPASPADTDTDPDKLVALEIRNLSIIDLLLSIFKFCWVHGDTTPLITGQDGDEFDEVLDGRELSMLRMLSHGLKDDTIARSLGISSRTLRRMMTEAMRKLKADSRFQAGAHAMARGLLDV